MIVLLVIKWSKSREKENEKSALLIWLWKIYVYVCIYVIQRYNFPQRYASEYLRVFFYVAHLGYVRHFNKTSHPTNFLTALCQEMNFFLLPFTNSFLSHSLFKYFRTSSRLVSFSCLTSHPQPAINATLRSI